VTVLLLTDRCSSELAIRRRDVLPEARVPSSQSLIPPSLTVGLLKALGPEQGDVVSFQQSLFAASEGHREKFKKKSPY